MPYRAVVFDLDGTLVESHIDYEKMGTQIKELLEEMGMNEHIEDRRKAYAVIRGGAETLLEYGLPKENLEPTLNRLDLIMNNIELEALPTMQLKPNAAETLIKLHENSIRLGVATRSHGEYAIQALTKFNLTHYFHGVIGRDETQYPKPDPRHLLSTIDLINAKPEETLYIGDTTTDLTTSQSAKVDFIGYWRDDEWAKRLMDGGCTRIIKDLYDIVELAGL
ncbi:HAD family hydrolase [Candidatus Bathyarchaeota archaeon]|nr:MAG: HAD family hydrolase [Candidatus Bathyarchaeota archaeon]